MNCDELWMTVYIYIYIEYKYYIMCKLASHVFQCLWWWGGNWMHEVIWYIKWEKLRSWMKMKCFFSLTIIGKKHMHIQYLECIRLGTCVYIIIINIIILEKCVHEEIFTLIYCKMFVVCNTHMCDTLSTNNNGLNGHLLHSMMTKQ